MNGAGVLVCIDAGYAMPLAVMLRSLGEALETRRTIEIFVLHMAIPDAIIGKIAASVADLPLALRWIAFDASAIPDTVNLSGYSGVPATYARLLFDRHLPPHIRRVLYLDPDLLVRADIAELLATAIPCTVCAVPIKPSLSQLLGFVPAAMPDAANRRAFNAGVMLIDRARWVHDQVGARALALAADHGERFRHWDQDALNVALAGAWTSLPGKWNHRPDPYGFPSWSADAEPADAPAIVHFAGPKKPWHPVSDYAETGEFFAMLDRTAWRGWRPPRLTGRRAAWERFCERSHRRIDRLRESAVKARRSGRGAGRFGLLIVRELVRRPWLALTYPVSRRGRTIY